MFFEAWFLDVFRWIIKFFAPSFYFFFKSQNDFIKKQSQAKKIQKFWWDDFHFDWKNENGHSKIGIKNTISKRFISLIQFQKIAQIFLKYYFDLILILSYNKLKILCFLTLIFWMGWDEFQKNFWTFTYYFLKVKMIL